MVTNYTVLIYGAMIAVSKLLESARNEWLMYITMCITVVVGIFSFWLLIQLHYSTQGARGRKDEVIKAITRREKDREDLRRLLFGKELNACLQFFDKYSVLGLLSAVIIVGGIFTVWVLWILSTPIISKNKGGFPSMESWFTENILLICLASGTFLVALLTFLSSVTDWLKRTIPIQFGFLIDSKIVEKLELSTGDPAKPIFFRFRNSGKSTLTGLVFDIRFHRPIGLSGTGQALTYIPEKTTHGLTPDNSYYLYRHSELVMAGEEDMDFRVELNTQNKSPGTYKVTVTVYSTQRDYKYKKAELIILMK